MTAVSAQTPPASLTIPAPSDVAAPPADAIKTVSGLTTKLITVGSGKDHPGKEEVVTIHYTAWTTDGKMFDSSVARGKPATLSVNHAIPGLAEGLRLMVAGETRRLWIPQSLAYSGQAGKPPGTLVFDVSLIDLPTRAPADVKAPPPDAMRTPSGLAYKVLTPGAGTRHPRKFDLVTVHYTGWATDGKMFDSSVARGKPSTFPLDRVIPGWTEGMQLMVEGEKARFWIPQQLAYQGKQPPYGMLVFDVELINIQ
jgi:FKBP-type peptidyl-prolyl cis-trans isomerase